MSTTVEFNKSDLLQAMRACVENGQRLYEESEWLGFDGSPTAIALCILAQEEFAKAFLLHLVCEGTIPWTAKVRESLHNHKHKQLVGLIMEWLSPTMEGFHARVAKGPGGGALPIRVADAMKLYVQQVVSPNHISCPPNPGHPAAKKIAGGHRDKIKQDALYVRLSEHGQIVTVPSPVDREIIEAERERTQRVADLVRPLREGASCYALDYHLVADAMKFLLLDKRNRPFLLLKETKFGGAVTLSTGTVCKHSVSVVIENISDEGAVRVTGCAGMCIDMQTVRPSFRFNEFTVTSNALCSFPLSEEVHALGTSPSHNFDLFVHLEYHGSLSDQKYHASIWSTYDLTAAVFRERFTDSQESPIDCSEEKSEATWHHPSIG